MLRRISPRCVILRNWFSYKRIINWFLINNTNLFLDIFWTLFSFQSPRFKSFRSGRNSLDPALRLNLRLNSDDSLYHVIDSCKIFCSTLELGQMKIKPTLVGFSGDQGSMFSLVLIKTRIAPIPFMKI